MYILVSEIFKSNCPWRNFLIIFPVNSIQKAKRKSFVADLCNCCSYLGVMVLVNNGPCRICSLKWSSVHVSEDNSQVHNSYQLRRRRSKSLYGSLVLWRGVMWRTLTRDLCGQHCVNCSVVSLSFFRAYTAFSDWYRFVHRSQHFSFCLSRHTRCSENVKSLSAWMHIVNTAS